jgi:RimJ/RimL family protein N-acetyltransferase
MPTARLTLETERLRLTALTARALECWIDADGGGLTSETGARFPDPVEAPPLFGEDLPVFHDRMVEAPRDLGWWVWLVSLRDTGQAVGVCGLGGRPIDGTTMLGYSVYPEFESNGYATEASLALVEWVFEQPGARRVRATVPEWNEASVAVARKLGMTMIGTETDDDVGAVSVYEVVR